MWLYRCIFILFPFIVNCLQDNVQVRLRSENPEVVFTDVIKNISRVNNVLEELINNYEQLKNMYKSTEENETGESDTEIDEVFKAKEGRKKESKTTQKPPRTGEFPATQMFWSDDEKNSNSANVDSKKGKSDEKVIAAKDTAKKSSEHSYSDQSTSDSSDVSSEKEKKNSKTTKTKPVLRKTSEILLINTHKITNKIADVKQNMMEPITKESKTAFEPKTINAKDKSTNNTKNVHKVVHAESFSKHNIWNEIIHNKPIQLQKSQIVFNLARKPGNVIKQANLRSSDSMFKGIQTSNNNKKTNDTPDVNFDKTEEEVIIKKEQFKTDVLRTAYGDACLKLVVTKCNRACTAAGKVVCRKHNCKTDFNNKYKTASKKGCRKEFRGEDKEDSDTETASTKQSYLHYRGERDKQESDTQGQENSDFVDITRGGYLSGACLSSNQDKVEPVKPGSFQNDTQVPSGRSPDVTFNVLRDRYEEACKRVSAGKCKRACFSAFNTACKDSCNKDKKKTFKKACRDECKKVYKLRTDDSGSDEYSDLDNE